MKMYTEAEIDKLGETIGAELTGGEVIELVGDVGTGKTTLTKAIARGLKISDTVHSPTFTISNRYMSPAGLELVHYDFYRLNDAGIMAQELDETINTPRTVTIIEWADVVQGVLPSDRLTIVFRSPSEITRELSVSTGGPNSKKIGEVIV